MKMGCLCLPKIIFYKEDIVAEVVAEIVLLTTKMSSTKVKKRNSSTNKKIENRMPNLSHSRDEHWMETIFEAVRRIPPGRVSTYGALAELVGTRLTARMVGWAMNASHKSSLKVPAHRVVNRNGVLTGKHHFETPTRMQELLEAEGVVVKDDKIVHFKELLWLPE